MKLLHKNCGGPVTLKHYKNGMYSYLTCSSCYEQNIHPDNLEQDTNKISVKVKKQPRKIGDIFHYSFHGNPIHERKLK